MRFSTKFSDNSSHQDSQTDKNGHNITGQYANDGESSPFIQSRDRAWLRRTMYIHNNPDEIEPLEEED